MATTPGSPHRDPTTAGSSQLATASLEPQTDERAPETTPVADTSSFGPRLRVSMDANGVPYLVDPLTGTRYEVSDDEAVPDNQAPSPSRPAAPTVETEGTGGPTPSSPSSITREDSNNSPLTPEMLLASLIADLSATPLSEPQLSRFSTLRGIMSLSRDSLLTTTGLVAGQRDHVRGLARSLRQLRNDVAERFVELSEEITTANQRMEVTLSNNLRVLRATGATDAQLAQLVVAVQSGRDQPLERINLDAQLHEPPAQTIELEELRPAVDRVLPPRRDARFADERAPTPNVSRDPPPHLQRSTVGIGRGAVNPIGYNQSISGVITGRGRDGDTTPNVFELFLEEKAQQIHLMISRALGQAIRAPPRPPKLPEPSKYKGEDDDTTFMTWLSRLCTWLQGNGLGGQDYEDSRIVYLKTALESHAIEWFDTEVEPLTKPSEIDHSFEAIVCAMHRRFVTTATATRATKEYEAVRYDESKGVEFLASELKRTALKMREPPADITLRQRFMRLLPADVHNELIRRGLYTEYVEWDTLKNHARMWIEGQGMMRRDARASESSRPARATTAKSTTRSAGKSVARSRATTRTNAPIAARAGTAAVNLPSAPTTMSKDKAGPNSTSAAPRPNKTCFGCGLVGHIASDPVCPRFNESVSNRPRTNAQIRAQRVVSSYSDDEDGEEELASDEGGSTADDEVDGLWGGDQYDGDVLLDDFPADHHSSHNNDERDAEETNPHEAPDLAELIDGAAPTEARVGAMQYFAMRIDNDETPDREVIPGANEYSSSQPMRTAIMDTLVAVVGFSGLGHPEWDLAREDQERLDRDIHWDFECHNHDSLIHAFEMQRGVGPYSGPALQEGNPSADFPMNKVYRFLGYKTGRNSNSQGELNILDTSQLLEMPRTHTSYSATATVDLNFQALRLRAGKSEHDASADRSSTLFNLGRY
ncbi:hypothetical protein R3P38DRAFT_3347475 [Favolaschia claudopus]|uniref:Retrotransposon gag domain-containing protein n=1 Tax=Favolaschia claudopus TaxID=2862362 RepID=A0AAW0CZB0_9AGAR